MGMRAEYSGGVSSESVATTLTSGNLESALPLIELATLSSGPLLLVSGLVVKGEVEIQMQSVPDRLPNSRPLVRCPSSASSTPHRTRTPSGRCAAGYSNRLLIL